MSFRARAVVVVSGLLAACEPAPVEMPPDAAPAIVDAGTPEVDAARPPPFVGPSGPTAGCDQPFEMRGVIDRTLTIRGVERRYRLVVPESYDPATPHALVFAFHGLGDRAENFQAAMRFETTAEGEAIVVYPHGVHPLLGANAWDLSADGPDMELFDTLQAQLEGELCVERAREYAIGFSYGAFFANALGCRRGEVIRAIGAIGGGPPQGGGCVGQAAAVIVHGEADDVIPYESFGVRAREFWKRRDGCDATGPMDENGCIAFEGCDEGYPVVFCSHPGGHIVPTYARPTIWSFFEGLPSVSAEQ